MQAVAPEFHQEADKDMVSLAWGVSVSFDKVWDDTVEFASYDVSEYDGGDVYSPTTDEPINFWDKYKYLEYSQRLKSMEWSREMEFPYSVSAAMADFTFNNTDNYFTPGSPSPIEGYMIPKRPVRLYAGYRNMKLQQFVGITDKSPVIDEDAKTATFHANDFLTEIFAMELTDVIAMENVTSDEVIAAIFNQFGLPPSSYVLAKGRNKIPFVFFDTSKNAGNAIRETMQAEGGNLWIDENGIIRFETRLPQVETPVYVLDDRNTFTLKQSGQSDIINSVKITSVIRKVAGWRDVYSKLSDSENPSNTDENIIAAGSSGVISAELDNPCLIIDEPSIGEKIGESWFTAINLSGTEVSGVTVTGHSQSTNQYTFFVSNTNPFPVQINQIYLWGRPALQVNVLKYLAQDADSVEKYGVQQLGGEEGISNDFFGSYGNADSFAETIIDSCKDFNPTIEADIAGDLALQLGDVIDVQARGIDDTYRITAIKPNIYPWSFKIKARRYNPREYAYYDIALYDDGIYAP